MAANVAKVVERGEKLEALERRAGHGRNITVVVKLVNSLNIIGFKKLQQSAIILHIFFVWCCSALKKECYYNY